MRVRRKLVGVPGEGFNVPPYYRAENLEGIPILGARRQAGSRMFGGTRVESLAYHRRWRSTGPPKLMETEALDILDKGSGIRWKLRPHQQELTPQNSTLLLQGICNYRHRPRIQRETHRSHSQAVLEKLEREHVARRGAHGIASIPWFKISRPKAVSARRRKCFARITTR